MPVRSYNHFIVPTFQFSRLLFPMLKALQTIVNVTTNYSDFDSEASVGYDFDFDSEASAGYDLIINSKHIPELNDI